MKIRTRLAERAEDSRVRPAYRMPNSLVEAAEQARDRAEADLLALGILTDSNWQEWSATEMRLVHARRAVTRLRTAANR